VTDTHRVHEALEDLITELRAHLSACQRRVGENDAEVRVAYDSLRDAAARYDDLLFDTFDEVTPFDVDTGPSGGPAAEELAEGGRFALLLRRDFLVDDVAALLEVGRRSHREEWSDEAADAAVVEIDGPGQAVYQLLQAQGVDGLTALAEDAGLSPLGGTLWVQLVDADDESLTDEPFDIVDEELVLYRVDELYEDGEGDLEDDDVEGDVDDEDDEDDEDEDVEDEDVEDEDEDVEDEDVEDEDVEDEDEVGDAGIRAR
jgi:hypothetical protein